MRDVEVGDIYGDGVPAMAIATHDQGVVATLRPNDEGGFSLEELDRQENMFVHEIELGDLNGDGVLEIYATPSEPNKMDGSEQYGTVTRYIPAIGEGRYEVADLEGKHAKEILVTDVDGDGKDELYVSIEAVAGGQVEIRRYLEDTYPTEGEIIATIDDHLCRFLTVGDVDGDGSKEMVAAAAEAGIWLLRPKSGRWTKELIDDQSSSFEHAAILVDLDADGRDELYVASDDQGEFRRYDWSEEGWSHQVLYKYEEGLEPLTWNITVVPNKLIHPADVEISDIETDNTIVTAPEQKEEETIPEPPRGLMVNKAEASDGYVLFSPFDDTSIYLINKNAEVVHTWETDHDSRSLYLLENGNLLRGAEEPNPPVFSGGGQTGRIQEISWEGELLWDWKYADEDHLLHHDIERLPNGNVLAIAWEYRSPDEAAKAGRRLDLIGSKGVWPTRIIEVKPIGPDGGEIVWQWHAWDHLIQDFNKEMDNYGDPSAHPELININGDNRPMQMDPEELARLKALGYVPDDAQQDDLRSDLFHVNAIDYNAELDQIVISSAVMDEIWIIDHSTTIEEAAGHIGGRWGKGGDLLYRWGNPQRYNRGGNEEQRLGNQHNIQWIDKGLPGEGHLLAFNNQKESPDEKYSAIYEWIPPTHPDGSYVIPENGPIGPDQPLWKFEAEEKNSFYSSYISGTHRLSNGNTFICSGDKGRLFEVTPEGEIVWDYLQPYSVPERDMARRSRFGLFRATKIEPSHLGLANRILKPLDPQPQTAAERVAERQAKEALRGLIVSTDKAAAGYTLFAPHASGTTYLIDNQGQVVKTWESDYRPGNSVYLLENGNLLRAAREKDLKHFQSGGRAGRIQEFTWDGELIWDWTHNSDSYLSHHDVEPMPNGNILVIAWEAKTVEQAKQAGRRPELTPQAGVWPDKILEVRKDGLNGGAVVWKWHAWDHLIQDHDPSKDNYGNPSEHPELIHINAGAHAPDLDPEAMARLVALGYVPADADAEDLESDLFHINAVSYNAELDQIALSTPHFNEIWILDHSTTTEEAAGHTGGRYGKGGDLLYRWGNPQNYGRGTEEDRQLFYQHNVHWIPDGYPGAGNFILFNNRVPDPDGEHSTTVEIVPPLQADGSYQLSDGEAYGPEKPVWTYAAPNKTYIHSTAISGAHRLKNGNTLICEGDDGKFIEVSSEGETVWEYWEPFSGDINRTNNRGTVNHSAFRVTRIDPSHPGLAGRELQPLDPQPETAAQRKAKEEAAAAAPRGLVFDSDKVAPGYTLFSPFATGQTFLMDENEHIVNVWESEYQAGCSYYLLDNGNLLRCARGRRPTL